MERLRRTEPTYNVTRIGGTRVSLLGDVFRQLVGLNFQWFL